MTTELKIVWRLAAILMVFAAYLIAIRFRRKLFSKVGDDTLIARSTEVAITLVVAGAIGALVLIALFTV